MTAVAHDRIARRPRRRAPDRATGRISRHRARRSAPLQRKGGILLVQHEEVRAASGRNGADRLRNGLRAATRRASPQRCADRQAAGRVSTLRRRTCRRCDHSSMRISSNGDDGVRIAADGEASLRREVARRGKRPVAEIGLGRGREPRHCAPRRERVDLALGHVRRVHDAPTLVHFRMVEQPLDRPHAAPGEAFLDLARLLGRVDVDGRVCWHERDIARAPLPSPRSSYAARCPALTGLGAREHCVDREHCERVNEPALPSIGGNPPKPACA